MLVERNDKQIIITLTEAVDSFGLQRVIDYVKFLELTGKSKAKQADIDELAEEVNKSWWKKNRSRFTK